MVEQLHEPSQPQRNALDVVTLARRRGRSDLTLSEILHALRAQAKPGAVIEKSSLSRDLKALVDSGLLLRRSVKRKSAWEALPAGVDQQKSPSSFAYYAPGAGTGVVAPAVPGSSVAFY